MQMCLNALPPRCRKGRVCLHMYAHVCTCWHLNKMRLNIHVFATHWIIENKKKYFWFVFQEAVKISILVPGNIIFWKSYCGIQFWNLNRTNGNGGFPTFSFRHVTYAKHFLNKKKQLTQFRWTPFKLELANGRQIPHPEHSIHPSSHLKRTSA